MTNPVDKLLKRFARWMYMETHDDEIREVVEQIRASSVNPRSMRSPLVAGKNLGAIDTLQTLDLLER